MKSGNGGSSPKAITKWKGGATINRNQQSTPKKTKRFLVRCVQKSGNKTKSLYAIIDFESEIYPDQAARALDRWHEKKGDYQVLLQNEQNGSITAKHLNAFLRLEVHTRYASVDRIFRFILSEDERLELSNLISGRY